MPARTLLLVAALLLPPIPSLADSPGWSVSSWLTVDPAAPIPAYTRLVPIHATAGVIGGYPTDGFGVFDYWRIPAIRPCWFIGGRIHSPPVNFPTNRGSAGPPLWYHWVASKSPGSDSVCFTSNATPIGCWSMPGAQLPVTTAATEQLWPWRIEDVRVFDYPLTAPEIAALYADPPAEFLFDYDGDGDVDGADLQAWMLELTLPDPTFLSFFATKLGRQELEY